MVQVRQRKKDFLTSVVDALCPMCDRNGTDCHCEKSRLLNCIVAFRNYYIRAETEKLRNKSRAKINKIPLCNRYVEDNLEWV